jgi:hypothetical protein
LNEKTMQALRVAGDPCVQRTAPLAYNEDAMKKAHADVVAFLKEALK